MVRRSSLPVSPLLQPGFDGDLLLHFLWVWTCSVSSQGNASPLSQPLRGGHFLPTSLVFGAPPPVLYISNALDYLADLKTPHSTFIPSVLDVTIIRKLVPLV